MKNKPRENKYDPSKDKLQPDVASAHDDWPDVEGARSENSPNTAQKPANPGKSQSDTSSKKS